MYPENRRRGVAVLFAAVLLGLTTFGCSQKDATMSAAPPPAPGAKAPPPNHFKQPRTKLPPLVGKDGKRAGTDL